MVDGVSQQWYPPRDWVSYTEFEFYDTSNFDRYIVSLYYAILIYGSNELGPVNNNEMIAMSFMLLVSLIVNSLVLGNVVELIQAL